MADPFYDERLEEKAETVEVGNDVKAVDQFLNNRCLIFKPCQE